MNQLFSFENGMLTVDNFTTLQEIAADYESPTTDVTGATCDDATMGTPEWCSPAPPIVLTSFSNYTSEFYEQPTNALTEDQTPWSDFAAPTPDTTIPPDNIGCFASNLDSTDQPFASRDKYMANIAFYCTHAKGFVMADFQQNASMTFPISGNALGKAEWNMFIGAAWNIGDPMCNSTGGSSSDPLSGAGVGIDETTCNKQLQIALDGCDTSSQTQKYGGYTLKDCVTYILGVDGSWLET